MDTHTATEECIVEFGKQKIVKTVIEKPEIQTSIEMSARKRKYSEIISQENLVVAEMSAKKTKI